VRFSPGPEITTIKHIYKILKLSPGDSLRAGVINGQIGTATINSITKKETTFSITTNTPPPTPSPIKLVLAVPRPIMLKRVIAQATSLGIKKIYLVNANRVEKSFFNASIFKEGNLQPHLVSGLEQSIDTILPEISVHHRFKPFIQDILPPQIEAIENRLIAHPEGAYQLKEFCPHPSSPQTVLAIGPEGGWVDFEIRQFQDQGFSCFTIGQRILRVDTAVPAILAQLNHQLEQAPQKL